MHELARLRRGLSSYRGRNIEGESRASVAMILRDNRSTGTEILFIHRAELQGDPWSGHMAFPGGRVDGEDSSTREAAVREVREEIGVDLNKTARDLGRLSDLDAMSGGRTIGLIIEVRVFELISSIELHPNEEVQDTIWIPLLFFLDRENLSEMDYRHGGNTIRLPCYRYKGKLLWGLSLMMLEELLALAS